MKTPSRCGACGCELLPNSPAMPKVHRHGGRGLCLACYNSHQNRGLHLSFDRVTRPRAQVLDAWELHGGDKWAAARALSMTVPALERALQRARRRQEEAA
jgi:hypothetical protein